MASIETRVAQNGKKSYRVVWREVPRGPKLSRRFETHAAAKSFAAQLGAALDAGIYVNPKRADVTFEEYAKAWATRQRWRPNTRDSMESIMRLDLFPAFGPKLLSKIERADVEVALAVWTDRYAESTTNVRFTVLRSILKSAIADGVLRQSPAAGIRLPKPSRRAPLRLLTTDQVLGLADAIRPEFRAMVFIGAGAGLRNGEALATTRERIEWAPGAIRVEATLQTYRSGQIREAEPKTRASVRTVPVSAEVLDEIALHLERVEARGRSGDGYLFTTEAGRPILRTYWGEIWRKAVADAGLPKGTRFHELRHYYASLLIAAGVSVKAVQARLGHASPVETLETYAHLWPNSEDQTREAVSRELARARAERAVPMLSPSE